MGHISHLQQGQGAREGFQGAEVLSPTLHQDPVDPGRLQPGQEGYTVGGAEACPACGCARHREPPEVVPFPSASPLWAHWWVAVSTLTPFRCCPSPTSLLCDDLWITRGRARGGKQENMLPEIQIPEDLRAPGLYPPLGWACVWGLTSSCPPLCVCITQSELRHTTSHT